MDYNFDDAPEALNTVIQAAHNYTSDAPWSFRNSDEGKKLANAIDLLEYMIKKGVNITLDA